MRFLVICIMTISLVNMAFQVEANEVPNYVQLQDVVFAEVHGTGLLMDVFTPTGPANGHKVC